MNTQSGMIQLIRKAAKKKILFLPHAVKQISHPARMISVAEVRRVIERGEIIENYPEDIRGPSCLILGHADADRPIHVVCSPKAEYLAIITAYLPDPEQWEDNFKKRKQL